MIERKQISRVDGNSKHFIFETPDICPMCNKSIEPVYISGALTNGQIFSVFYYCRGCDMHFLTRYKPNGSISKHGGYEHYSSDILKSEPQVFTPRIFDKSVSEVSPKFTKIYNEALMAEKLGLLEIAGSGYRKSLEFLIKEYAIHRFPEKTEYISRPNFSLQNCINEFIDDDSLRTLATATYWIGNDETHFSRKHSTEDLDSLLKFFEATVNYIAFKITTAKAEKLVSKPSL